MCLSLCLEALNSDISMTYFSCRFCSNVALSLRPTLTTLSKGVASLVSVTCYLLSTYYTFVHLKTSRLDINVLFFQLSSNTTRAVTDRIKTTRTKRKSYKHILKPQEVLQYRNALFLHYYTWSTALFFIVFTSTWHCMAIWFIPISPVLGPWLVLNTQ